jgi:mono/diheme cytochrome c family protein
MQFIKALAALVVLVLLGGAGFVYSGAYDIGADEPHWALTSGLVATLRDRSIEARARGIDVPPDLASADRVRRGAGNYDAMCAGCHLKPGVEDSEIRKGLYPLPPNLAGTAAPSPARQFWVIKHGIKMTAMPAWSKGGVDDGTIWDMVALLQRLPALAPGEYDALVAASPGHTHAGAGPAESRGPEAHPHDHAH